MPTAAVTLYHSPNTRSSGTLTLLEELGMPYELKVLDMKAGEQRQPPYLAVNPMGKVPAIRHGEAVVTEQGAIYLYLADLWPQAGLAPPIGDPLRGPYLRWIVFYGSSFEPAMVDRALKREPGRAGTMPYGDVETTIATLKGQLARGPWILGERFTAADVLWGTALTWMISFGLLPAEEPFTGYIGRWNERPSVARVRAIDAKLGTPQ
jgi:glutathione S-transferase